MGRIPLDQNPFDSELDALLDDLHRLLDDDAQADVPPEPDSFDYFDEPEPPAAPAPEPQPPVRSQPVRWTDRQRVPRHVAKLQQNQEQAYADWLYEQDRRGVEPPPPEPEQPQGKRKRGRRAEPVYDYDIPAEQPKRKKRHGLRNFLVFLLVLTLALVAVVVFVLPRQPRAELNRDTRRDGVSTILLIGTDQGGARTDTLMLLTADRPGRRLSLVSIPRDTLVNGTYSVPKINSVYGANNGGAEGIEMLLTRVEQCVGFRPDGYILIRLDAFVDVVDALGGIRFDVPVDMFYNDPSQDLYIDLAQGLRTLSGQEAMGLVRFRSGYADADLGRVQVQRQFLSALIDQAVSLKGVVKSPLLLRIFLNSTETDLTAGNFLWLAETALLADRSNIQTATLPGSPRVIGDGAYYVLDPASVAQTVSTYCTPYERDVTTGDLEIRQG